MYLKTSFISLVLIQSYFGLDARLSLPKYYSNGMVMQADQNVHIWGFTDDNASEVTINAECSNGNFEKQSTMSFVTARNKEDSFIWEFDFVTMGSNGDTCTIIVSQGTDSLELKVILGDVWLCSGQSNMEFKMRQIFNSSWEISDATNYPNIKMFQTNMHTADSELDDIISGWDQWHGTDNAEQLGDFSSICFLTAKYLTDVLGSDKVFGLINTVWGGTRIEAWMSNDALDACDISDNIIEIDPEDVNSALWNAMLHPLLRNSIKGVMWYQGEANACWHRDLYSCTFPAMIADWRTKFNEITQSDPNFPFGFVQLATVVTPNGTVIRWRQTANIGYAPNNILQNVFMAVALDTYDPEYGIHPRNKQLVAKRFSYSGLNIAYEQQEYPTNGPFPRDITNNGNSITIEYDQSFVYDCSEVSGFYACCQDTLELCDSDHSWSRIPASSVTHEPGDLDIIVDLEGSCQNGMAKALAYLWEDVPFKTMEGAPIYSDTVFRMPGGPWQIQL